MSKAVFLDRDGTVIEEKEYLSRPEGVRLLPGAGDALRRLQQAGYLLILVTNQSGIGRGYFTFHEFEQVQERLQKELAAHQVQLAKTYFAPEAPHQPSRGRKPSPQFLYDARDEFGVDLGASYMIGDKLIDIQCGWNAGVKQSILVRTGYGAGVERTEGPAIAACGAVILDDLPAAADWILRSESRPCP